MSGVGLPQYASIPCLVIRWGRSKCTHPRSRFLANLPKHDRTECAVILLWSTCLKDHGAAMGFSAIFCTAPQHTPGARAIPFHTMPYHTVPRYAMPYDSIPHYTYLQSSANYAMPCNISIHLAIHRYGMPGHAMPLPCFAHMLEERLHKLVVADLRALSAGSDVFEAVPCRSGYEGG